MAVEVTYRLVFDSLDSIDSTSDKSRPLPQRETVPFFTARAMMDAAPPITAHDVRARSPDRIRARCYSCPLCYERIGDTSPGNTYVGLDLSRDIFRRSQQERSYQSKIFGAPIWDCVLRTILGSEDFSSSSISQPDNILH